MVSCLSLPPHGAIEVGSAPCGACTDGLLHGMPCIQCDGKGLVPATFRCILCGTEGIILEGNVLQGWNGRVVAP